MTTHWLDFINAQNATLSDDLNIHFPHSSEVIENTLCPLIHLSILKVSGSEASQFLQGQLSCHIGELTKNNSFFTAYSNAKGRTLTTLFILKKSENYLLILPTELIETISKKLKMYIMRSDVQLQNISDTHTLLGIQSTHAQLKNDFPQQLVQKIQTPEIVINIPLVKPCYEGHGVVVWCRQEDDHYELGIRFEEAEEAFKSRMVSQVCQIEHYKKQILEKEGRKLNGEQAAMEWISKFAADFADDQ